jgi:NAD(P)-dependent dehydrogenase (short-subunit alcohol dehydrogenase family)
MPNILIIGASRGLGLELAGQFAAKGWRVLGTVRDLAAGAKLSARGAEVHLCDVADPGSIARLADSLADVALDIVFVNAGVFDDRAGFGQVEPARFMETVKINTLAPLLAAQAFAGNLTGRKVFAAMSSKMGAMSENTSGGCYSYRASKAALNMVITSLALDLASQGVTAIALSPGWVKTDMGGSDAPLDAPQAMAGVAHVLETASLGQSGKFLNYDGGILPW